MLDLLLIIGIILLVIWALGAFSVINLGSLMYVALVIAVILVIIWLLKRVLKAF